MKKIALFGLCAALLLAACQSPSGVESSTQWSSSLGRAAAAVPGFSISNGKLIDANGNLFIFQGINHAHTWYKDRLAQTLTDLRGKNANSVRLVLSNGTRWTKDSLASVVQMIDLAKANQLISILEVHDTTGYGEDAAATTLNQAADYFVELKSALQGQEAYVIVNIGNEPYGNTTVAGWYTDTVGAVQKLRAAGIRNTIMVDAPNWGQDWSNTMRTNAAALFTQDPDRNLIFSVHMYQVYSTPSLVTSYIQDFVNAGLPLVIGEFGNAHQGQPVAYGAVMSASKSMVNGYLGWSWSGNSGGAEALDLVTNWNAAQPTAWGTILFNDLVSASVCSVFSGGGNQAPVVSLTAPAAGTVFPTGAAVTLSAQASDVDGTVAQVAFFAGNTLIAEDTAAPYSAVWTAPAAAGTVVLRAVATDNQGLSASSQVSVVVQSSNPQNGISAVYTKNDWGSGFTGSIRLTNTTTQAISQWRLSFTFGGNQTISHFWSAAFVQSGQSVQATPLSWNTTIQPGQSIDIGFNASYSGTNAIPTDLTVSY